MVSGYASARPRFQQVIAERVWASTRRAVKRTELDTLVKIPRSWTPRGWEGAAMRRTLGGVALSLLVGSVVSPAEASVPIPKSYGLYAIERDELSDGTKVPEAGFSPSVQFLFFSNAVSMGGGWDIFLQRAAYVRYHIDVGAWVVPDTGPVPVKEVRPVREWSQPTGSGFRRPAFLGKVEVRVKPVPGQGEMILIVPTEPLKPGVYVLQVQPGTWWRFAVERSKLVETEPCLDFYLPMSLAGAQYEPCARYDALESSSGPGRQAKAPTSPDPARPSPGAGKPAPDPGQTTLETLTRALVDAKSFAAKDKLFPVAFDAVWTTALQVFSETGDPLEGFGSDRIATADRERGVLITRPSLHSRTLGASFQRQYVILIERFSDTSTRVGVKGLCYDIRGARMISRWPPERCTDVFLEELAKRLPAS